ncbi:MAG TPA: HlyD family efflux transporter periplasmic adaptor subunit [Polyangiaceae bacterium]|nr:HlyD family efflux transporter periplasmic adaptor subunit [Polyangiaceae bacterium]
MTESKAMLPGVGVPEPARHTSQTSVVELIRAHGPRLIKSLIGICALGSAGWMFVTRFVIATSTEAVLGGTISTVRAPIAGMFDGPHLSLGDVLAAGQPIGKVRNHWADDTAVRELRAQLDAVDSELTSLGPMVERLKDFRQGLVRGSESDKRLQVARFRSALSQAQAYLAAHEARASEASGQLERNAALSAAGLAPAEAQERASRDAIVAQKELEAARQAVTRSEQELRAVRDGLNVGVSGLDRPYSAQRADEISLQIAAWDRQLAERQRLRDLLATQLAEAKARHEEISEATLSVPRKGRVWQVRTAADTFVEAGANLVSLVDCENVFAVAMVSERVFDGLRLFTPARFKFQKGGDTLTGKVVQLVGATTQPPGTLLAPGLLDPAVAPRPLEEEPYLVIVALTDRPSQKHDSCTIGQSGTVEFD